MNAQQAVWLYGSVARGDAQVSSDVDILVVGGGDLPNEISERFVGRRLSLSRYGWDELMKMALYGSLFLHHVKVEGSPLFESPGAAGRLRRLLGGLPRYQRVYRDLRAFRQSLLDIAAELPSTPNLLFELATVAALIRRMGILGSYLLGEPRFDRVGPVVQVVNALGLPSRLHQEFGRVYQYRLAADGIASPNGSADARDAPDGSVLALWIERADLILSALEVHVHEERTLREENSASQRDCGRS